MTDKKATELIEAINRLADTLDNIQENGLTIRNPTITKLDARTNKCFDIAEPFIVVDFEK